MQKEYSLDFSSAFEDNFLAVKAALVAKPNINILEIGTYEGRSTLWFCEHCLGDKQGSITTIDIQPKPVFFENTLAERQAGKINYLQGTSFQVLLELLRHKHQFDLIYIDGSHLGMHVLEDAILCWRLLKNDGILFFDDYCWNDPALYNTMLKVDYASLETLYDLSLGNPFVPKVAIDSFLAVYGLQYELLFMNYQLAIKKSDAFIKQHATDDLFRFGDV